MRPVAVCSPAACGLYVARAPALAGHLQRLQCLLSVAEEANPRRPPRSDGPDHGGFALHLDPAAAASAGGAQQCDDARSALAQLLRFPHIAVPDVAHLGVEAAD